MPFPKRRNRNKPLLTRIPSLTLSLFDASFVFQKSKQLFLYGFTPAVILIGMLTEPKPASWLELINILE